MKFNKSMLFIQFPPQSTDIDTQVFSAMGFAVEFCQIMDFKEILAIQDKYRLADFDVILLDTIYHYTVPTDILDQLKRRVHAAEAEKQGRIHIVGMALDLKEDQVPTQLALYDGLFLHQWKTPAEPEIMFVNLFAEDNEARS